MQSALPIFTVVRDTSSTAQSNPPHLRPVVVVVIDQDRHVGIAHHVAVALWERPFVRSRVEPITLHSERHRHDMRSAATVDGGKPGDLGSHGTCARSFGVELHERTVAPVPTANVWIGTQGSIGAWDHRGVARAVGFDLDMTLVDTRRGIEMALVALAEETGRPIDAAGIVATLGPPVADVLSPWFGADEMPAAVQTFRKYMAEVGVQNVDPLP